MSVAQTIVGEPKYGASRRDAQISSASEPVPAPKTSSERAVADERSRAVAPARASAAVAMRALDDDERAVVGQLAVAPGPAVLHHRDRELLGVQPAVLGERAVEPVAAVELASAPRLDEAVGVDDERRAGRQRVDDLLVLLVLGDPEHEAARRNRADGAVGLEDPRLRMPGARDPQLAGVRVEGDVDHRDELPGRDLAADDVVREREEVGRLG